LDELTLRRFIGILILHCMKVIHQREKCIGCGSCAALCPKYWEMSDDGKSKLLNSRAGANGDYELEVGDLECNRNAAEACPVECIQIIT
jgi:ferredoxin